MTRPEFSTAFFRSVPFVSFFATLSSLSATGCGAEDVTVVPDAGTAVVGVNDVKKACELRTSWPGKGRDDCINCLSYVLTPVCPCVHDPDLGKCADASDVRSKEADCTTSLSECLVTCKDDCACIDGCYAGHDVCKQKSAARDGCATAICEPRCM